MTRLRPLRRSSPHEELKADLTLEQLKQLVGLVEYDASSDPFPVTAMDAVGFVVGNATQTANFYQLALGMDLEAYRGPETGHRDPKSYVLRSGSARFVFTGGVTPDSPVLDHHRRHGDGVVDLALEVPDVDKCIEHARSVGATILDEPHDVSDEHGTVRIAAIATYGETRHTLIDRSRYDGPYLPGYVAAETTRDPPRGPPQAAVPGRRPLRRQRRARPDGRVGRVLQQGHRLHEHGRVHRRRHRHRLLRADVEGRRERQPPGEVPAQRAGRSPRRSRRSTSTSSSTTAPAASTSRSPPTTSCAPSTSCATTASSSSTPPTPTTTTPSCAPGSARCGCRSRS